MVRLRNAVMAVALGTGVMGCGFSQSNIAHYSIWHCDECDDFPDASVWTGLLDDARDLHRLRGPRFCRSKSAGDYHSGFRFSPPPQRPRLPTTPPATPTLPLPPPGAPGQGTDTGPAAAGATGLAGTLGHRGEWDLPHCPPRPGTIAGTRRQSLRRAIAFDDKERNSLWRGSLVPWRLLSW